MKPLELVGKAISNSSRRHESVLDLFGGSGSTMIASDQLDRKSFLMELDERFVDVIVKRYIKHKESDENCYLIRNGKRSPISHFDIFEN
jgi:DNA modification methylase